MTSIPPSKGRESPGRSTSPTQSTAAPAAVAGAKRKRGSGQKIYAVKNGFQPGIYHSWDECFAQVKGFKGAVFQSFLTQTEANAFLTGTPLPASATSASGNNKFYGVQRGRQPGVYTDWAVAQDQIKGFRGPKYRKFATWAEADEFVREGREPGDGAGGNESSKKDKTPSAPPGMMAEPLRDEAGNVYPAGTGPLPPGAEDGFDPNVLLNPSTGRLVYKTAEQKAATKLQPKQSTLGNMLNIYTDGSALGNGKLRAKAGVGVYFGPGDERNVSEPLKGNRQTNQRAELTAISRALDIAPRHRDVTIYTDSKYSIDCVTVWCIRWQRNKWMTADSKPVENKDLIQSILTKIEERTSLNVKTLFEWVKGHNKHPGNEAADRLAVRGARVGLQAINDGVGENGGGQNEVNSNLDDNDQMQRE
ncbi:ribonuclease H [Uncinocarpus reesii 1704]|uniref:Ribonuclease H n=1 Tax=Uncinocarpus reesii (strain UAMH 1704) TaxID=336963 RepID=C4JQ04_UNCRE|nr:ribonuclease H [Uncinocarpus reesii 1704]EEP78391.1 ribonuclease H [Uncinocarpus reesii 1704]